jgi:hypothetical protein
VDIKATQLFTLSCSGDCSGYFYFWQLNNPPGTVIGQISSGTGTSTLFTASSNPGSGEIQVFVSPPNGVQYSITAPVTVVCNCIQSVAITPNGGTVHAGKSIFLYETIGCSGTCNIASYQWSESTTQYLTITSPTQGDTSFYAKAAYGNTTISLAVTDSTGKIVYAPNVNIESIPASSVQQIHSSISLAFPVASQMYKVGTPISIHVNFTSILSSSNYVIPDMHNFPSCVGVFTQDNSEDFTYTCTPTAATLTQANATFTLWTKEQTPVEDAVYWSSFFAGTYFPLTVSISALPNPVAVGSSTIISTSYTGVPSNGAAKFDTASWSGFPAGCATNNTSTVCVPGAVGNYVLDVGDTVSVSGATNNGIYWGYDPYTLQVVSSPPPGQYSVTANPSTVNAGGSVVFYINTTTNISIVWRNLPTGCSPVTTLTKAQAHGNFSCTFNTPGSFTVTANVTDANGTSTIPIPITVNNTSGSGGTGGSSSGGIGALSPDAYTPYLLLILGALVILIIGWYIYDRRKIKKRLRSSSRSKRRK